EKYHKGCPLVAYHTGGAGFTGKLEYDGRIYGTISVNVPRDVVMDTEEQRLFQKLVADISIALAAIERDETGRQAEEQIRLQAQLLDAATDSVQLRELDGSLIYVNKATCDLTGYTKEELFKMNLSQIVAPEQSKYFPSRDKILLEDGNLKAESAIKRKDGTIVPVDVRAQIIQVGGKKRVLGISRDISERKESEQKIIESETKYRNIFNQAPISIIVVDAEGNIVDANPHHFDVLLQGQVKAEDYIGQNILTNTGIIETGIAEDHASVLRGKTMNLQNITLPASSLGPPLNVNVKGVPLLVQNKITGAIFIVEDITAYTEAEKKLQDSERKFRIVFDNATDGILLTDLKSKKHYMANNTFCRMLGYTHEEIQDLTVMDIHPEEAQSYVLKQFDKQVRGEKVLAEDIPVKRKDGNIFYAAISARPIILDKTYMLGLFRDITEQKQAVEALSESERRYRLLAENITDIIWTADMDFRFTYVSPSVKRIRGYSAEEALKQTLEEILTPASLEVAFNVFKSEIEIENSRKKNLNRITTIELEEKCKDGSTVWTESSIIFLRDPEGNAVGILGVTRDISERKKTEKEMSDLQEQLRQSQKLEAIGSLAGGIAHDFNNLLTVISGYGQLAVQELKEGDPLREKLKQILAASTRASDLTRQLLAFSRRQVLEIKVLDLNILIHGIEKMLRR
ncbi:PAS domain S-box protein, partial [Candidatus Woesearchaeota archaeon]|nr:PAS domain S-box protein [Candidatus Woesearchaeota archaeon]